MLSDIFKSVAGIDNYGLISTILFLVFFGLVVIHTLSLKKKDVDDFSKLPFDNSTKDTDDI
ncbi:MAG: hypothetical protein NTX61_01430 [Bacteroidetes bacterium]|nr:hypothetical protein [Bacteroidota bacterium]